MKLRIDKLTYLDSYKIEVTFNDNCLKQFDFSKLLKFENEMEKELFDISLFKNVKIVAEGGGIGWTNNYDCCADWLRYYAVDESGEWANVDDIVSLQDRMRITMNEKVN